MKRYINIHVRCDDELHELAVAVLAPFDFNGIEEAWDELIISFNEEKWNELIREQLISTLRRLNPSINISKEEVINDRNWNEEWEKNVQPIIVNNRIGIAPEWKKSELKREIEIVINPKMSFGTGDHATTRLVCRMMDALARPGQFWVDAGTGTGVLAILASILGASRVVAFDNNEWSINNARENFALNGVEDKIELSEEDIDSYEFPECDAIAANLFLNLLLPNFEKFYKALAPKKGFLLCSGVMKYDLEDLLEAGKRAGFRHVETLHEDEWVGVHFAV